MRLELALSALHAGARAEAERLWFDFDRELRAHLELEEQYILPALARTAPAEAAALRTAHRELRRRVEKLGIGLELHLTREAAVQELFATHAAHAAREEHLLHGVAQDQLPVRSCAAIRALLLDARMRFIAQCGARG